MNDHMDITLTDTERARINYCPNCGHSWSLHAPHGCAVCECRTGTSRIFSAVESIVAARVAAARADERAEWVTAIGALLPRSPGRGQVHHLAADLRALIEGADQ